MSDIRPDTGHDKAVAIALAALIVSLAAVIAAMFAISFYGLQDYGRHLAGLPGPLSFLVPVGIDVLSLCALTSTFLLRTAPIRVRIYAWSVFCVPVGLSIAGNLAHAMARHLPWEGMVGAGAWPVVVALAAHLVVVTLRYVDRTRDHATEAPWHDSYRFTLDSTENVFFPTEPATPVTFATDDTGPAPQVDKHATAKARRRAGATIAEIATDLGVSERTVQRWTDGVKPANKRGRPARRTTPAIRTRPGGQDATPTGHTDTTAVTADLATPPPTLTTEVTP